MNAILRCAAAGFAATVPMTVWMLAAHRFLPPRQRYPLPPELITGRVLYRAGLRRVVHDAVLRKEASLVDHFSYGAATGALYAPLLGLRAPVALKGLAFGLFVWGASYLGLMPALGILRPATREPARRNALMIVAHFIWGAATAFLAERSPAGRHR